MTNMYETHAARWTRLEHDWLQHGIIKQIIGGKQKNKWCHVLLQTGLLI